MKQIYANNFSILVLGRRGENLARQVTFDVQEWESLYGSGSVELIYQRPGDELPYPIAIEREGTLVKWTITATDTDIPGGYGKCELWYYVGKTLAKSRIWRTWVESAMDRPPEETPPEPEQGWVNQVLQASVEAKMSAESAKEDADRAAATSAHQPIVQNGTWWTWDAETGEYQDTGAQATGPKGESVGLPEVTEADNGKFARVINGAWAAETVLAAEEVSF